jgi:hypothetical protein
MWNGIFFSCSLGRESIKRIQRLAGQLEIVLLNASEIVPLGSLKQERSAGSLTEPYVKEKSRPIGRKR